MMKQKSRKFLFLITFVICLASSFVFAGNPSPKITNDPPVTASSVKAQIDAQSDLDDAKADTKTNSRDWLFSILGSGGFVAFIWGARIVLGLRKAVKKVQADEKQKERDIIEAARLKKEKDDEAEKALNTRLEVFQNSFNDLADKTNRDLKTQLDLADRERNLLKDQIIELKAQSKVQQKQIEDLIEERIRLNKRLEDQTELMEQVSAYREEAVRFEEKHKSEVARNARLVQEMASMRSAIEVLERDKNNVASENSKLQERVTTLESKLKKYGEVEQEVAKSVVKRIKDQS